MEALFLQIFKLSISASFLVLAAIVLRLLFRRAPKWIACGLWALVGVRLLLPFRIESAVSVAPDPAPVAQLVLPAAQSVRVSLTAPAPVPAAAAPVSVTAILAWVWLAGLAAMALYAFFSTAVLRRRLSESVPYSEGIRCSDRADTPFVLGIFRPVIYLPSNLCEDDVPYILAHERAHIRRRDHIWKPLGFALLSVYWFNPVLWLAYILLCRDIEAACDERVIREMSEEGRRAYSGALLNCAVKRRSITACPIAFGEGGVKGRIKSVMNYRKPAFWLIILAVLASVIAAVCLLTTRPTPETTNAERPMLFMDGKYYVDPYMPESTLPAGYIFAGELTRAQANNTGLEGTGYYANPDSFDFYTYQLCGTPTGLDTVDSENRQLAYLRWIPADFDAIAERRLTMDAVLLLAQKGSELTWADFDRYACEPTGYHFEALGEAPAVLRTYPIDKNYEVVIGGSSTEKAPEYIILRNRDVNAWVDLRTQNAEEFVAAYQPEIKPYLTLDDVKQLAKKGMELTVEDFEPYDSKLMGSGISFLYFPMLDGYSLRIAMEDPLQLFEVRPFSITLSDGFAMIDIRVSDVEQFLALPRPTVTEDSYFNDFEISDSTVKLKCHLCIDNPRNESVAVTINGDFGADVGLVTQTSLAASHPNAPTDTVFTLKPGENSFNVEFIAPYGGIPTKHDRLLPPITLRLWDPYENGDEEPEPAELPQLVLVNGILYENTGRESDIDARCGTMDGAIESAVESWQEPTEERQSNFGTGYEFQYVTNEEIDVVIDGKWMIFRSTEPFPARYFCTSATPEEEPSCLILENGWFEFRVSQHFAIVYFGRYTLTDSTLTLNALDGENFVFDRTDDGFRFRADSSTLLPSNPYSEGADPESPFGDGAIFKP